MTMGIANATSHCSDGVVNMGVDDWMDEWGWAKKAPQIWRQDSLQLTEFREPCRSLPDFSKHVRSGECAKTQNLGG
jgi:hypothetical protein